MAGKKSGTLLAALSLTLFAIAFFFQPVDTQGGTIYRYVDKDGSVVFTNNPPPGVKAEPLDSYRELTEEELSELEKERSARVEKYRKMEEEQEDKQEKIKSVRTELERAKQNEQRFRSNMNQAHGFAQRNYWKKQMEEQQKEIEELEKKIKEIKSGP